MTVQYSCISAAARLLNDTALLLFISHRPDFSLLMHFMAAWVNGFEQDFYFIEATEFYTVDPETLACFLKVPCSILSCMCVSHPRKRTRP